MEEALLRIVDLRDNFGLLISSLTFEMKTKLIDSGYSAPVTFRKTIRYADLYNSFTA